MSKDNRPLLGNRVGRSTNPFDSDFEDDDESEEIFHDAFTDEHDVLLLRQEEELTDAFTVKFLSPLESALFQLNNCERWSPERKRGHKVGTASKQEDYQHLINPKSHRKQSYGSTLRTKPLEKAKRNNSKNNPVLEELCHVHDGEGEQPTIMDTGGPNAPWTKLLLLEELGTASSWALLLAPYVAVCICLFLESYSGLSTHFVEQPRTNMTCLEGTLNITNATSSLIIPPQQDACLLPVALQNFPQFDEPNNQQGWAYLSEPITHVPPMSVYLRAGARFDALSSELVMAIAKGQVLYSTLVVQHVHDNVWEPISISVPETLALECIAYGRLMHGDSLWNCTRSQMVDVIFSFPGTGILAGTDLRLMVMYAPDSTSARRNLIYTHQYASNDDGFHRTHESYVTFDSPSSGLLVDTANNQSAGQIVQLLATMTELTIEHERPIYYKLDFWVRSLSLVITFSFVVFWFRALQSKEANNAWPLTCCCGADKTLSHGTTKFWWESPWIIFPERRYLLIMLFCLMLLQNPLLILAFLHRDLYRSRYFHAAADCIVGVGVFGILMMLHCLFQGLRYHTAEVNRRRAKQQREFLELRRAANYLVKPDDTGKENAETISMFIAQHYETFGDVSGFSTYDTRLRHDPCGHDWPDFLLPKVVLFLVGAMAVLVASTYRFSAVSSLNLSLHELRHVNMVYISSSFVQLFVAFFWMVLIVRQTSRTAFMLRKEPFLSTRPAQLSFRILLGILLLGLMALVVPIIYGGLCQVGALWALPDSSSDDLISDEVTYYSVFDVMLEILAEVSRHFPYSGTAASIGPGKIIYATVCTLVASIIFLPSHSSVEDNTDDAKQRAQSTESQAMFAAPSLMERKRDKRLVVTLARYTKTWRVFPLPIRKVSLSSSLLAEMSFHVDKGERSLAYFGKYTPVFCLELACWLLEASWQAYYTPHDSSTGEFNADRMALENIGLKLEKCVCDESTDSQVFVASNMYPQVDGFEDSIIVVGLRGTVSMRNVALDMKLNQVPLLDQIIGMDFPMFEVSPGGIKMNDSGDWFWDSPYTRDAVVKSFTPKHSESCFSFTCHRERKHTVGDAFSQGAKAVLASTPVTRQTLPCVHQGFLEAYSHIRKQVFECIMEVMQRQLAKAMLRAEECGATLVLPKIYVTGHSLGGSVGQLLALDLACNVEIVTPVKAPQSDVGLEMSSHLPALQTPEIYSRRQSSSEVFHSPFDDMKWLHRSAPSTEKPLRFQPPVAVYTYGQPRVGNYAFSRLYKQKVPHTFRCVNEGDALTTMPNAVLLGGQYKHAGLEVMLDEGCTGNILVGPTVVETMFRFSKVRTSLAAHSLERYRENLESGLTRDELHEYIAGHGIQKSSNHHTGLSTIPEWLTQVKRSSLI